jgi:hypothetical protein
VEAFVRGTFLDGCVAETLEALDVRRRADEADDEVEHVALRASSRGAETRSRDDLVLPCARALLGNATHPQRNTVLVSSLSGLPVSTLAVREIKS